MTQAFSFFFKGVILGISIAAPVGPIGVLCIRRTLAYGMTIGFLSGLGAAAADIVYGLIAAFGLTSISNFLIRYNTAISLSGSLFLAYLGIKILFTKPAASISNTENHSKLNAFVSTFFLTITNPMTILSFVAIFAGIGIINTSGDYGLAFSLVSGIFIGSAAWFMFLSGLVGIFRSRIDNHILLWINRISGIIILGFASHILIKTFTH